MRIADSESRIRSVVARKEAGAQWRCAPAESKGREEMKKALVVPLTDEELLDLCRVIIDRDAEGALEFVNRHLRKKVEQALEGG